MKYRYWAKKYNTTNRDEIRKEIHRKEEDGWNLVAIGGCNPGITGMVFRCLRDVEGQAGVR